MDVCVIIPKMLGTIFYITCEKVKTYEVHILPSCVRATSDSKMINNNNILWGTLNTVNKV